MNRQFSLLVLAACTMFALISSQHALAAPREVYVPDPLQPWVEWVLERHPHLPCAALGRERVCNWPGKLALTLNQNSGQFTFRAVLDADGELPLPGGNAVWPQAVSDSGKALTVLDRAGRPYTYLKAGEHSISGTFSWNSMPEALLVPVDSGLIELTVFGERMRSVRVSPLGEMWLKQAAPTGPTEADSVKISVSRKLSDGVPFKVDTRLDIRIAGSSREIDLGQVSLTNGQVIKIQSALSYHFDANGALRIQGRPGVHVLSMETVFGSPPEQLSNVANSVPGWPDHEVWIWAADEKLRSVEVSGGRGIDPERTSLPAEWRGFPAYLLGPSDSLTLKETRRGEQGRAPNIVNVMRRVWLDLDGAGYTLQDTLNGTINQGWRINMQPGNTLGHVALDGEDQVITRDPANGLSGVEVRSQALSATAESRIEKPLRRLSAVGWDVDAKSLSFELNLPPGWSLLDAGGVDQRPGTWAWSWDPLGVFLVLAIAAATTALFDKRMGLLALCVLVLCHGEMGAPYQVWFHLLLAQALLRVLPEAGLKQLVRLYLYGALVCLALIILPFIYSQIQTALFPQLGEIRYAQRYLWLNMMLSFVWGPVIAIFVFGAIIAGAVWLVRLAVRRDWKGFLRLLTTAGALAIACAVISAVVGLFGMAAREQYSRIPQAEYKMDREASMSKQQAVMPSSPFPRQEPAEKWAPKSGLSYLAEDEGRSTGAIEDKLQRLKQADPKAIVQTGPGVPSWSWKKWTLNWNGPVKRNQHLKLYLLSPGQNAFLSVLRVLLLTALASLFVRRRDVGTGSTAGAALLMVSVIFAPPAAYAQTQQFPGPDLLQELENRLLNARCTSGCTTLETLSLEIDGQEVKIQAAAASDGSGAVALPGPFDQFLPERILVDGAETSAIRRDERGLLWVRVANGTHSVSASGRLIPSSTVTLQFGSAPKRVLVHAPAWDVDGISETGSVGSSLQLIRKSGSAVKTGETEKQEVLLPPWFIVERRLDLGIPWTVRTKVLRLGNTERAQLVKIPLVHGEAVNNPDVKVEKGEVLLTFARGESSLSWASVITEEPQLTLRASATSPLTEVWQLGCSTIYRCKTQGLLPAETVANGENLIRWHPFPGEEVIIGIEKPQGIEGQTITVDRAAVNHVPGLRLLDTTLELDVRSSHGGWQLLKLPAHAEVQEVSKDGQVKTIRPKNSELHLPLTPGMQTFRVQLQQPFQHKMVSRFPRPAIDGKATNVHLSVQMPSKRWVLWAQGPKWGPVFVYWGEVLLIVLAAFLLGKKSITPLGVFNWILLGLGLSHLPAIAMIIPPLWFIALSGREKRPAEKRTVFNALQVGLTLLTFASAGVLYAAIAGGLSGSPDMSIAGFGSSNWRLQWYAGHSGPQLPSIVLFSVPLGAWHALMFAWAFWLCYQLFNKKGWIRWAWACFATGGIWRPATDIVLKDGKKPDEV